MGTITDSVDVRNKLEDLSGVVLKPGENPYKALIEAGNDDPAQIQALYAAHRARRNAQQREKFLAADYQGLIIDQYLLRLENPHIEPGFKDERNCMTFWGRPPIHILKLADAIQRKLAAVSPNLWLMPLHQMHITTLEVAFCRSPSEIASLVETLRPAIPRIASYTYARAHRARLVKPMVSYDLSALALSFLPAAGEDHHHNNHNNHYDNNDDDDDDRYTYHHLRRDIWDLTKASGVTVDSRYVVPSAHVTLGRYLGQGEHATATQRRRWVEAVEEVNAWLEAEVWGAEAGEWVVGQERGLDVRVGTLWYGGGRTVLTGEGF
ncbi:60S ribosomal protein L44 [Biscogniauxia mediterranea]|nr:60S ribosomal protein L44 [Biscogniauxia mediterranea]